MHKLVIYSIISNIYDYQGGLMEKTVLLVDDEVEIIDFLENFLKRFKISSVKVTSGEEALEVYREDAVGFVFLDIQLPGINGIEVLTELKKINPAVKVIMITGRADNEFQQNALRLGAIDYVTKPLDLGELKEKIQKYIVDQ